MVSLLKRRLEALERDDNGKTPRVGVVIRHFLRPGDSGPVDTGTAVAKICSGANAGVQIAWQAEETISSFEERVRTEFKKGLLD